MTGDAFPPTGRVASILLGSLAVLMTVPTGIGPAVGGWVAGRLTTSEKQGATAGFVAGIIGGVPWVVLVYLASAGAFEPIGYHEDFIHIGINTVDSEVLSVWQEVGIAVLFGCVITSFSTVGGAVAGKSICASYES